jgi:hypothetical protein
MKKMICTVLIFTFLANVSAQLEVDATGNNSYRTGTIDGGNIIAQSGRKLTVANNVKILLGSYNNQDLMLRNRKRIMMYDQQMCDGQAHSACVFIAVCNSARNPINPKYP